MNEQTQSENNAVAVVALTPAEAQAVIDSREFANGLVATWRAAGEGLQRDSGAYQIDGEVTAKPVSRELSMIYEIAEVMGLDAITAIDVLQKYPYQAVLAELAALEEF